MRRIVAGLFVSCTLFSNIFAEVIEKKDGTVIAGEILSFFEKGYIIRSASGDVYVKKADITAIRFDKVELKGAVEPAANKKQEISPPILQPQKPVFSSEEPIYLLDLPNGLERRIDPRYSTPQNTFKTWKNAATQGRLDDMVRCYADSFQHLIYQNLRNMTEEQASAMVKETQSTQFKIDRIVFKGLMAFVHVIRKKSGQEDEEILNLTKENGAWKLMP